mmetsp:Transcript_17998/g.17185  ORF Transcript_17998/g.17185 Transcript_17998/m.17185 type:complete len:91 (+) Transcript_17998:1924-2196(+)
MDLGLKLSIDEIHLFFQRYNKDEDNRLKYSEFSEGFMPQDQHFAFLLSYQKRLNYMSKPGRCPFNEKTLDKYLYVWELIVNNENVGEQVR